jgi:hypothetical protein
MELQQRSVNLSFQRIKPSVAGFYLPTTKAVGYYNIGTDGFSRRRETVLSGFSHRRENEDIFF